ncbi:hypothetical protein Poli38472_012213 [Pythium oligandrum]|uniref:Uncharacterized protein n=1 Tax=Pythium oligandrum TaxID=41045 RepID=A0A8K1FPN8_PYTOL|nr:hypothetical protein Poli38472_012213 [Pythium oligandrum]|eukprot:TMW67097.1 hypothetical protein Poli38472_012213 [Pythium oligandrum]
MSTVLQDEIDALHREAAALARQLQRLQNDDDEENKSGAASLMENAMLREKLKQSGMMLAEAQSILSHRMRAQVIHPMETFIHLAKDPAERRRTLMSFRDQKLHGATEFMVKRTRFMDLRRPHRHLESCEALNGDCIVEQFAVIPFEDVASVKQVYDGLLLALFHQEYAAWEKLGVLAVCESDDADDSSISQSRYLTEMAPGVDLEKNGAMFCRCTDGSDQLRVPHGLVVTDSIDEDELYPYDSEHRLRLDLSSIKLVWPCPRHDSSQSDTVSIVRWTRARIHRPHSGLPMEIQDHVRGLVPRWSDAMNKTVREYVAQHRGLDPN